MSSSSEKRSIIAMKGHPFTRKTEFAAIIATSLSCPVLCLDNCLDVMNPDYLPLLQLKPQDLAFQIMCQIAKYNLVKTYVKHIVIDSPLSSQSHLNQLIELASSLEQTRLVIVECKTANIYEWQTRFEERSDQKNDETREKWYKAKSWEDVEKAVREGYDERSDGYNVPKLMLDPISDFQKCGPVSSCFMDAIKYMMKRSQVDGPDLVVYREWLYEHNREEEYDDAHQSGNDMVGFEVTQSRSCRAGSGHSMTKYAEEGLNHEVECVACTEPIVSGSAAYSCDSCQFHLHKECAELIDSNGKPLGGPPPDELEFEVWFNIPSEYPDPDFFCDSCLEYDTGNSCMCGDCIFINHLRSRRMPTVIRHDCDEHFLSVVLLALDPSDNFSLCKACGESVRAIWYSCKICGVAYHYRCLTQVPSRVEHVHGGHHHHMTLQYSSEEAEDYMCDVCFESEAPERRDPNRWFYSCQDCVYIAHMNCVHTT